MTVYERGETYINRITVKNENSQVTTPSSIKQSVYDPCNVLLVDAANMTNTGSATGKYHYNWSIPSSATYGRYDIKVNAATSTSTTIFKDEFYVLPWAAIQDVRQSMGVSDTKSISDKDLANIIWSSYKFTLRDLHEHHHKEKPKGDPDTGVGFDGTNTTFQTRYHPIADINGDGQVTGTTSCATDISGWWIDSAGHRTACAITVTQADNGEICIYQSDGTTAIPANNEGVYIDYWVQHDHYDSFIFQQAVVRSACHEISKRFAGLDKVNLADIRANNPLIVIDSRMYWNEYLRYINLIRKVQVEGA